jgi:hypothetical protein
VKPRTRSLAVLLLVACLAAASCTGDDDGGDGGSASGPTSPVSAPPTVDQGPVDFVPGSFRYEFNGVTAELTLDADAAGTLDVKNASGAGLAVPALYLITGEDARLDATIADAAAIADGEEATFQVSFADPVDVATLGLVILEFGDQNYGGMAPVPVEDQG